MDQNYIDIDAHIRRAQKLRSEAMGVLISSGLDRCKQFLVRFQYSGPARNTSGASPSAFAALQDRP